MPLRRFARLARTIAAFGLFACLVQVAWSYPTAFTYQGVLKDAGGPANGSYDMEFNLYDSPTIGSGTNYGTVDVAGVVATAGIFTVTLNFGNPFFTDLYLEIGVKPAGSGGGYVVLTPRQAFTSTPYSLQTLLAQSSQNLAGLPASRYLSSSPNGNYGIGANPLNGKLEVDGGSGVAIYASRSVFSSNSSSDPAVYGDGVNGYGVHAHSLNSIGLFASSVGSYGVVGQSKSHNGVFGYSDSDHGVYGFSDGVGMAGVFGQSVNVGVKGEGTGNAGSFGVLGSANGNSASAGVRGTNTSTGAGMIGYSAGGHGVRGDTPGNSTTAGVYGQSTSGSGVRGYSSLYIGVFGESENSVGVYGTSFGSHGVYGLSTGTSGIGVYGDSASAGGTGVYARNTTGGRALYVQGTSHFTGAMDKPGGSFKIDHPLDPENKYLSHSFVESPDMMNIYNGNVTTDGDGRAVVELPEWLEALNRDFRYQLTVIGTFAQAIVAEEVRDNRFAIATSVPNVKVSWQVTGIRRDAYAEKNRIRVEEPKPAELQGTYLQPAAFGLPEEYSESFRLRR